MRSFANAKILLSCVFFAAISGVPTVLNAANGPHASSSGSDAFEVRIAQAYGDLPLNFEANQGQTDSRVRFLSRGNGYNFFLTSNEAVLAFSGDSKTQPVVLHMQLAGAKARAKVSGVDQFPGTSNYFLGKDPNQWHTGVPTFRKIAYENIYPGINLVYYGNHRQLEYDFIVGPGADPGAIRLAVEGALKLTVDAQGNLILHRGNGDVSLLAPRIYQETKLGEKQQIEGRWTLAADHTASFLVGPYDHSKALVVDPVLTYSSFLGGSEKNTLNKIVVDSVGNAYVAGFTAPGDFPAAPTPQSMTFGNGTASRGAFVAKIDPTGSNLLYTTYLSGSADEAATGLAVDAKGNVYVTGYTHSTDFPVQNAYQATCAVDKSGSCADAFLTKIAPTGDALVYSTYLGGSGKDSATGLAVDSKGSAYVVGTTSSVDFPVTAAAAQTKCGGTCAQNSFVAKFDPTGAKLSYATYLGGSGSDAASDIALDASGNAYITGQTTSADFPLISPFQKSCTLDATSATGACLGTAFIAKLKSDGSALAYSTYLGGSLGSRSAGIAVDSQGSAYVTGSTQSADFPVLKPFQKSCGLDATSGKCAVNAFLTKLAPAGNALVYSTYLGGSGHDEALGVAVDASGKAHVVGYTESADFPTMKPVQPHLSGSSDAFVARFNASGSALEFSTYHGGSATETGTSIALDAKGNIYVAGQTSSTDFPTSHAFQSSCAGACTSAFVSQITPQANTAPTITSPNSITFLANTASSFTVTTTGTPTPSISDGGATLPGTVAFADNHDGTGTLAGTPPNAASTTNFTFTATNGVSPDATQPFTLTVCTGSVSVPDQSVLSGGVFADASNVTDNTFSVTVPSTCTWTTSTDSPSFLNISGGATGPGSGTFGVSNFTNAGASATSRTGTLFIVGQPFPVKQFPVGIVVSQNGGTAPVEAGQSANFTASLSEVGAANLGVTFTLTQGGNPCSPACGTLNNATANPVTFNAPASTDPANPPGPVTLTATSAFDNTRFNTATINVSDYTIGLSSSSGSVTQGQSISPAVTITGAAVNGYTGTLNFTCTVSPSVANGPTCSVASSITIPGSTQTSTTISTTFATPTASSPYTLTFTATDGKGVQHSKTYTLTVDPAPVLAVVKTHSGSTFTQGGTGTWTVTVSNTQAGSTTSSGLQVTDTLPTGYTLAAGSGGTNWSCSGTNAVTCTSSSTIGGGLPYPALTLNVNIPSNSPTTVSNTATATGGGAQNPAQGSDNNVPVAQVPANLTATSGAGQSVPVGNNFAAFSATVTDAATQPIQNVPVTFTVIPAAGGASCSFGGSNSTTVNSNASGVAATVTACTANTTNGAYTVQASVTTGGVAKPTFAITNTDFSLAFSSTFAHVAPGSAPAGLTLTATALSGYSNTSLTVASCVVAPATPTCSINSPITVGTPASVTLANTGTAGIYTVTATVQDSSPTPVVHQKTFTLNVVQVTISTTMPATLEVSQKLAVAGSATGLVDTNVNWSTAGAGCPAACGGFDSAGPNTGTNYDSPSSTSAGLQASIKATADGDATFTQTASPISITDYNVSLPSTLTVITQNSSGTAGNVSTLTGNGINGYQGTIQTAQCGVVPTPAGAPTCGTTPPGIGGTTAVATANSPVNVITQANSPVGLYSMTVIATDGATNPQQRTTSAQTLAVQCNYSLSTPIFMPAATNAYSIAINEVQGGNACPYGNVPGAVAGNVQVPNAAGDGTVVNAITANPNGTLTSSIPSIPITFTVNSAGTAPIFTAGTSGVTASFFQVPQSGTNFVGSLLLPVGLEGTLASSAAAGGKATVPLTVSNFTASGTSLQIAQITAITATTACSAVNNSTGQVDSTANFGITCSVASSTSLPGSPSLQINVSATTTTGALRPAREQQVLLAFYALGLGLTGIVVLGAGVSAFGPKRRREGFKRITVICGLCLLVLLVALLPSCSNGGISNNPFTGTGGAQGQFTLTVMGTVVDGSGNVKGVDIFTIPLNVTQQ